MNYYTFLDTPAGTVLLVGDGKVVNGIHWKVFKRAPQVAADWTEDASVFADAIRQLEEYFAGERRNFDFNHAAKGTDFQKDVWSELAKVPYGKSTNYRAIAKAIGRPGAVRAVGTAVGSNPLSIVVPCHRVLGSDGRLAGYAGGLASKEVLLRVEGISWIASS